MLASPQIICIFICPLYVYADPEEDQTDGFFVAMFQREKQGAAS